MSFRQSNTVYLYIYSCCQLVVIKDLVAHVDKTDTGRVSAALNTGAGSTYKKGLKPSFE